MVFRPIYQMVSNNGNSGILINSKVSLKAKLQLKYEYLIGDLDNIQQHSLEWFVKRYQVDNDNKTSYGNTISDTHNGELIQTAYRMQSVTCNDDDYNFDTKFQRQQHIEYFDNTFAPRVDNLSNNNNIDLNSWYYFINSTNGEIAEGELNYQTGNNNFIDDNENNKITNKRLKELLLWMV